MRVDGIQISNFRSIVAMPEVLKLGSINVLIGPNNSGKSSVLLALYAMQEGLDQLGKNVRDPTQSSQIDIHVSDIGPPMMVASGNGVVRIWIQSNNNVNINLLTEQGTHQVTRFASQSPKHFVVPFLSKRKIATYVEDVRLSKATSIEPDLTHLAARLSTISNPSFPNHEAYWKTCTEILGFPITATRSTSGQLPGAVLANGDVMPITQMGDGVPHIVALLVDLAVSRNKLFLIEEPENDLHPSALKALLDLMVKSSESNQFVVSTHSNIVARHLGGVTGAKLLSVESTERAPPSSATITEVPPTPEARLAVLRTLGYSFSDFELWEGWLILEESSAERIIRDYLVPWFVPRLSRIRTVAAGGNSTVEPMFDDFHRLVLFTHLEQAYRNAAWVRIDGDEEGQEIVERLRKKYSDWEPSRFGVLSETQFERYYPAAFFEKINKALAVTNKKAKKDAKKALLDEVCSWLDSNGDDAKSSLETSAAPVIEALRLIESELVGMGRLPKSVYGNRAVP